MIELSWIAEVLFQIYYSGRPKAGGKLALQDFEQMCRMANGTIMRRLYYDYKGKGETTFPGWYASYLPAPKKFDLGEADARGRRIIELTDGIMRLPKNTGFFDIYPYIAKGEVCGCDHVQIMDAGQESIYCGADFKIPMAVLKGKRIVVYNIPECVKEMEVEAIFEGGIDMQVPMDVSLDIANAVLGEMLKFPGFPVDKTNDQDPNAVSYKNRLQEKETI